jgi:phosphoglycerate kinase
MSSGAKSLVMLSHLGRPDGQKNPKESLKPLVPVIEALLKQKIIFLEDCVGPEVEKACENPANGSIFLCENVRFHPEEEGQAIINKETIKSKPDDVKKFRESLTKLGDIYVSDAFGTAHRGHSSMVGINLPIKSAGLLMKKELDAFSAVLENPKRPLLVILGGAKVKDKIKLINNILKVADEMIIGGGMAFTFLKVAYGMKIGKSLFDEEGSKIVMEILKKAEEKKIKIHLPIDFMCGDKFDKDAKTMLCTKETGIEEPWMGLDCGEKTIAIYQEAVMRAKSIMWNGPVGVFEMDKFKVGSEKLVHFVVEVSAKGTITVAGGGDTVNLIQSVKGAFEKFTHVSTGGGASLELMEGREMPGIAALSDKPSK